MNSAKELLTKLNDFYINNKPQIFSTLLMLSLHPHYSSFIYKNEENSNIIPNFLTYEDSQMRKKSLDNISYDILFDFSAEEKYGKAFILKGCVNIKFDFDASQYLENKNFLKIDYQGKVVDVNLNSKDLKEYNEYFINKNLIRENFVQQETGCIFINKGLLKKDNNNLRIKFEKEYISEIQAMINNPFLKIDMTESAYKLPLKVINPFFTH